MKEKQAKNYKVILTILLVGITIFCVFKYIVALKEKYALLKNLNQAKAQVVALGEEIDKEKELEKALSQENVTLKDEMKTNADKLAQLDAGLKSSQNTIDELTSQIALAKAENAALREEKDKLSLELVQVSQEKDTLKARLSSIPELKKAIKEVKIQIRKAKVMMKEITKKRRIIEGNRGFLVKNGESTFPVTKIKIEVMPAQSNK